MQGCCEIADKRLKRVFQYNKRGMTRDGQAAVFGFISERAACSTAFGISNEDTDPQFSGKNVERNCVILFTTTGADRRKRHDTGKACRT